MRCTNTAECGLTASFTNAARATTVAARWNRWPYKAAFGFAALRKLQANAKEITLDNCQLNVTGPAELGSIHRQESFTDDETFIAALVSANTEIRKTCGE